MTKRMRVLSIVATGAITTLLLASTIRATQPDQSSGATKPVAEQNLDANGLIRVHEQGTANTHVTNENLNVTLQNPQVAVTNFPATQNVTGSVHVNNLPVTQNVSGSVSVNNFPPTQNVNVVGNSSGRTPVTKAQSLFFGIDAGDTEVREIPEIAVSTLIISKFPGTEAFIQGRSPLSGEDNLHFLSDPDGDRGNLSLSFPDPIPLNGFRVGCFNESEQCVIFVLLAGF